MFKEKKAEDKLASIENSVEASIQRLEDYLKKEQRKTDNNDQKQYGQCKH